MTDKNIPRRAPLRTSPPRWVTSALSVFLSAFGVLGVFSKPAGAQVNGVQPSLKSLTVPMPAGLLDGPQPIVINREKAIALGKALFWDMNVGSDGVACATCHFHAGADARTKNQFSPGKAHLPSQPGNPNAYAPNDERGARLANYQLKQGDFPLHRFGDPSDPFVDSLTLQNPLTYNTVSSAGTFSGQFVGIAADGSEQCVPLTGASLDQTFNVGGIHTRRVEPRNTPTIINAVLFDRNFWDGRASFIYNGVSSSGARDPNAYVWVVDGDNFVWKTRIAMENASLASLAMAPPVNEFEMSCRGRTLKDVARKLLRRRPLDTQGVHAQDSALGPYRDASGQGLNLTYEDLIKAAFAPRYWSAGILAPFGKPSYSAVGFSQAEANFSLFFGLAIQLYASTLISDDTPFDRATILVSPPVAAGRDINLGSVVTDPSGNLTSQQLDGLKLFSTGFCVQCHMGPLFSSATNRTTIQNGIATMRNMVERRLKPVFEGMPRFLEMGFFNNGSVLGSDDSGVDSVDEFGNPLSYSEQYLQALAGHPERIIEPLPYSPACKFHYPFTRDFAAADLIDDPFGAQGCSDPLLAKVPRPDTVAQALASGTDSRLQVHGGRLFKIPQLYNVELTGPYMHNGGMATLEQAVDNYSRGGNFGFGNPNPAYRNEDISSGMIMLGLSAEDRNALVAFLKTLTDERVRYQRAPFDHPQLLVPDGHPGNQLATQSSASVPGQAADVLVEVPAVGSGGSAVPLKRFDELLPAN